MVPTGAISPGSWPGLTESVSFQGSSESLRGGFHWFTRVMYLSIPTSQGRWSILMGQAQISPRICETETTSPEQVGLREEKSWFPQAAVSKRQESVCRARKENRCLLQKPKPSSLQGGQGQGGHSSQPPPSRVLPHRSLSLSLFSKIPSLLSRTFHSIDLSLCAAICIRCLFGGKRFRR